MCRPQFATKLKEVKLLRAAQNQAAEAGEAIKTKVMRMEAAVEEKKKRMEVMRKNLRYQSAGQVDSEISKIEYQMHHTSLTLAQEKAMMAEIKALSQQKHDLNAFNVEKASTDGKDDQAVMEELRNQRRTHTKAFIEAKEKVQAINGEVTAAKLADEKANATVVNLLAMKKHMHDQIGALIEQNKTARQQFKQQEFQYNNWVEYQSYIRRQQIRERRKKEEEEHKAAVAQEEVEEVVKDIWEEEKTLCAQLLGYLQRSLPQEKKEVAVVAEREIDDDRRDMDELSGAARDDTVKVKKAKDGGDDSVLGGGTKAKKGPKPPKEAAAPAAPKPKKLTHTPDVFSQFDLIDLTPPLDVATIPAAIQQVQEKLTFFLSNPDKALKDEMKEARGRKAAAIAAAIRKASKPKEDAAEAAVAAK